MNKKAFALAALIGIAGSLLPSLPETVTIARERPEDLPLVSISWLILAVVVLYAFWEVE